MSNTDSTSVIDLPRVGCLLPTLIIEMELPLMCGACAEPTRADGIGKSANIGCCEDCDIRVMCKDCGTWDEEQEIWRCPDCQEEYDLLICGCCDQRVEEDGSGNMVNQGCCSDGRCEHEPKIEVLCGECGTWDEEDEVWRCPECQEEHEEEEWEKREKCPCGLTLSDDDMALEKVHDVRLCEGCFEENKKAHEEEELPPGRVTLEMLLEHVKKLQKEDPKKYEELNAKFQKCA